jgi:hypothetical protein
LFTTAHDPFDLHGFSHPLFTIFID